MDEDASVGGPEGGVTAVLAGAGCATAGARGRSGGAGGDGAVNTSIDIGVGNAPVANSGTTINTTISAACATIESGTVYQRCAPTRADGRTISLNISAIGPPHSSQR